MVSVLLAGGVGAAVARKQLGRFSTPAGGTTIEPTDASIIESIPLPNKREKTLRDAVEQYLSQKVGKPGDLTGGLGVCMDLGLFYLEEGRLTDADKLFTRLEEFPEPRSYPLLGQRSAEASCWLQEE